MPEGHAVHRHAIQFNKHFAGKKLKITSPQGRFAEGAAHLNNRTLVRANAVGKQLFLEFDNQLSIRIHLGIYGKWSIEKFEKKPEAPVGEVRVRFLVTESGGGVVADLRGPTACEVLDRDQVLSVIGRLGPDPLAKDARGEHQQRFVSKVRNSKTAIGLLLMNQDVISGIGNVYRAEVLFRAGVNPMVPGESVTEEVIRGIWLDAVKLMRVGVKTGFMITRDEFFAKKPDKDERNFVYKREGLPCRNCGTNIAIDLLAGRKLYWCPVCQK